MKIGNKWPFPGDSLEVDNGQREKLATICARENVTTKWQSLRFRILVVIAFRAYVGTGAAG